MNINFTITDIGGTEETGPLAYDYFRVCHFPFPLWVPG